MNQSGEKHTTKNRKAEWIDCCLFGCLGFMPWVTALVIVVRVTWFYVIELHASLPPVVFVCLCVPVIFAGFHSWMYSRESFVSRARYETGCWNGTILLIGFLILFPMFVSLHHKQQEVNRLRAAWQASHVKAPSTETPNQR